MRFKEIVDPIEKLQDKLIDLVNVKEECPT